jgi:hypothetical protein
MQHHAARTSLLPSALVLCDLLDAHAGNPPAEALEQAGFRQHEISAYLQRRSGRGCLASSNRGQSSQSV